jgi:cell division protein ZapA
MATTVSVTIAGRAYRMACGEGEEAHLQALARHVDQALGRLKSGFGEVGDTRLVIMAAITIADELFEAKQRVSELERQLEAHTATRFAADAVRDAMADEIAGALDAATDRIERITRRLKEAETVPDR